MMFMDFQKIIMNCNMWGDQMQRCPVCGSEMSDDDMFCKNCGFNPDLDMDEFEDD